MPPRKDPFAGDDNEDAANRRATERVRQARTDDLEERKPPRASDDEEEEIEIGAEPDDDDDDDEGGEPREPNGRPSRSERRRQRGDDLLRAERERSERLERLVAEQTQVLGRFAQQPQQQPQQQAAPGPDPLEQEAEMLRGAQEGLQARFVQAQQSKAGPEVIKALQAEAWALKDKIDRNSLARHSRALGLAPAGRQMDPRQQFQQVQAMTVQAQAQQRYGDVLSNPQAARYFQGVWQQQLALGKPDDWDTMDIAAEEARRQFRMASKIQRPPPTAGEKRRFSGQSRGAATSQSNSGPKTITMTRELKRMADAAYPHIKDAKKRYQKWANGPGAKLVAGGKA